MNNTMDEPHLKDMCSELAHDFSAFAQVDFAQDCQQLDVAVEDMLAKLEEFGSLMEMMVECSGSALSEQVPRVFLARQRLQQLFRRVDAMEAFVARAGGQLTHLEEQMDRAERDLAPPGSLTQVFSALFQAKRSDGPEEAAVFSPSVIFRSEEFFHERKEPRGVPE